MACVEHPGQHGIMYVPINASCWSAAFLFGGLWFDWVLAVVQAVLQPAVSVVLQDCPGITWVVFTA